ncbi:MAG TPA: hypothetical protein VFX22_10240, partial [Candidatus Kapabacteria bacterium]|nr:hypothetical protein [Candidatus Kapabacteria bacterium]
YLASKVKAYVFWIVAFVVGIAALAKEGKYSPMSLLSLLTGSLFVEVLLLSQTNYQTHPLMTLVILTGSVALARAWNQFQSRIARAALVAVVLMGCILPAMRHNAFAAENVSEEYQLIQYLAPRAPAGSLVQTAGAMHAPLALSLRPASRFIMLHALVQRNKLGGLEDFESRWRTEYLRDLRTKKPIYYLMHDGYDGEREFLNGGTPWDVIRKDMPEIGTWLDTNYHIEAKLGRYTIYRRNAP